jgi:hypothetical protein
MFGHALTINQSINQPTNQPTNQLISGLVPSWLRMPKSDVQRLARLYGWHQYVRTNQWRERSGFSLCLSLITRWQIASIGGDSTAGIRLQG